MSDCRNVADVEPRESPIAHLRGRQAVAVGKRLIRKYADFTGGYELAARGYDDLGRRKRAVRILERGVARRADAWRLLESLAIRYSDLGRLAEALVVLDRALALVSDTATLHYNRALVLARMDRPEPALHATLRALEIDPNLTRASLLAAALECAAGRLDVARERLEATIARLLAQEPPDDEEAALSDAYRALAEIELAHHHRDRALELFWKAIAYEKDNAAARYWVRELSGERNDASCYWRVVLRGRWPEGKMPSRERPRCAVSLAGESSPAKTAVAGVHVFTTLYDVVAESPQEALELIRPFEPPEVRPSLQVESAKIMKRSVADPKGVYRTSPYRWLDSRDERKRAGIVWRCISCGSIEG